MFKLFSERTAAPRSAAAQRRLKRVFRSPVGAIGWNFAMSGADRPARPRGLDERLARDAGLFDGRD